MQEAKIGVKAEIGGAAESALVGISIAEQQTELIEALRASDGIGNQGFTRSPEISVPASQSKLANAIVHERNTGIDQALLEVVIEVPLGIGAGGGLNAKTRYERRKPPCIG